MLKTFDIDSPLQLVITVCVVTVIIITTLGGSGGAPPVFFVYRTLLLLIAILCIMGSRSSGESIPRVFTVLIATSLGLMLISVLTIQGSHFDGFYLWYKHAFFIAAFLGLARYARHQSARWKGLLLGTVVVVNLAHLIPDFITNHRPIAGFSTQNANYFATFLLIGLAATLAVAVFGTEWKWRIAAAGTAGLLFFGIAQTWSRGATLAAGLMIVLTAVRAGSRIPHRVWMLIAVAGSLLILAATPYLVRKFVDRGEGDPYNYARAQIWLHSLPIIAQHPLLGTGMGQYLNVSKRFAFPVEGQVARYLKRAQMAHSEYLQRIAESGIPATALLFSCFIYLFYLAYKRAESVWPEYRCFQEAAILTAVGLCTHGLVDNCWTIPVMASATAVVALGDLLPRRKIEEPKTPSRMHWAVPAILLSVVYIHSTVIPGLALYYNDQGHQAYNRSDYANAERLHLAAIELVPDHAPFLDNLGMVYLQQFEETRRPALLDSARAYFAKAIDAAPRSLDAYIHMEAALMRLLTGDLQRDRETYALIAANNNGLLQIDPYIPFARKNFAEAYYRLGQRERAFKELQTALEYEPNYIPGYLAMAAWYGDNGKTLESEMYTRTAVGIANRYREFKPREAYEGLLLGRPAGSFGRPPR